MSIGCTCDLKVSLGVDAGPTLLLPDQWPCRRKDKVSILEHTLGASDLAEISPIPGS